MSISIDIDRKKGKSLLATAGILVVALLLPFIIRNGYAVRVVNMIILYSIISIGLNLIGGYGGQLAMGHACYAGIGAYTSAILMMQLKVPFLPALAVGAISAGVFGLITGFICLYRITGDYLMIVTIGISEITRIIFVNWIDLTGGPMGIPQVPLPSIGRFVFKTSQQFYYLFLFFLVLTVAIVKRMVNSKFGRSLVAIRENEMAARVMGIDVFYTKLLGFSISAVFAGISGSLLAHYTRFVGPMQYSLDEGLLYFQMIIIGGLGSIEGSILGSAIMVLLPELFRGIYQYRMLIYGFLMIFMMIIKPQGILGDRHIEHRVVVLGRTIRRLLGLSS